MLENYIEQYKKLGWKLIPLKEKIPFLKDWQNRVWDTPITYNGNIGIQTGEVSGIIVVDVDHEIFDDSVVEKTIFESITPFTRTGKGWHYYFKYLEGVRNSVAKLGPGIDIRSNNGYVVAPPSIHPDTHKPYEWIVPPMECPLAEFPKELYEKLQHKEYEDFHGHNIINLDMVKEGQRNNYLTSLAGTMRNRGFGFEAIYKAIDQENQDKCNPPLEQYEVRTIAESISKYEPQDRVGVAPNVEQSSPKRQDDGSNPSPHANIHKYSEIKKIEFPPVEVIPTGIKSLDQYFDGGLGLKELSLFVAEQETGKSTIACQIGANAVRNGYNVLHVFYEDELKSVKERYDGHNINPEESLTDVFLLDATSHPVSVETIEKKIKEIKPGLVIVDYFARIPSSRGLNENRFELRDTMMKLGNLARQNDCHVMVLDHVTITFKDYSDSKEPWCYKMRTHRIAEAKMFKLMVINLCIGMVRDKDEKTVWVTGMKNKRRARQLFKQFTIDWEKGVFNG